MEHGDQDATGFPAPRWVGFGAAVAICLRKYVGFRGRAGRPEFWFWTLFQTLAFLIPLMVASLVSRLDVDGSAQGAEGVAVLLVIAWFGLWLPGLAVTVRRLHDTDRSGWWILINLVPTIGGIWLLILLCQRGTYGPNRFGPQVAI